MNSVFASVSLPVSVNTQGTYLNQVYIGMFRPDEDAFPRWTGNLKQYKLAKVGSQLKTAGRRRVARPSIPDRLHHRVRAQFLDADDGGHLLAFRPQGGCTIGTTNYDNSNYPDGKVVEKGAQAYVLPRATDPHCEDLLERVRELHDAARFQQHKRFAD